MFLYFIDGVESWKIFFSLFHPKSLRINANCILRYQGNFSSCALTVFYCAHYHVLGVIFLIWVKPMQDINCVSLLVLALLFNPGMYECSKRNTTDKQNSSVFLCTLFMRQRVCEKFTFASVSQAFCGVFKKKSNALFLPQYHFRPKYWGVLTPQFCVALSTTNRTKSAAMAKLRKM